GVAWTQWDSHTRLELFIKHRIKEVLQLSRDAHVVALDGVCWSGIRSPVVFYINAMFDPFEDVRLMW
ncbi:hypothetical protein HDU80_002959, partial [Chytriomyces hyalinus]